MRFHIKAAGVAGLLMAGAFTLAALAQGDAGLTAPASDSVSGFEAACAAGDGLACLRLGEQLYTANASDIAAALARFDEACRLDVAAACLRLGAELEFPDFGAPDTDGAMAAYARGCTLGLADACDRAGLDGVASEALPDLEFGTGMAVAMVSTSPDTQGAEDEEALLAEERRGMEAACGTGDLATCEMFAAWLRDGTGGPSDVARARRIFSVICTQGSVTGCYELAWMMYDAGTDGLELSRARFLFTETCQAGVLEACLQAGDMRRHGEGGKFDTESAAVYYTRACEGGLEAGCQMIPPATPAEIQDIDGQNPAVSGE